MVLNDLKFLNFRLFSFCVDQSCFFSPLLLAVGVVILLLSTGVRRETERGGVCDLCGCVCLFWRVEWVRLGVGFRQVGHGMWCVRRWGVTQLGGSGGGWCGGEEKCLSLCAWVRSAETLAVSVLVRW